ncbi:MAG: pseudouridine synthase [Lachnospiraceae bacterium]|nr:pseudouridine synthase [Lachnospiraceae bacterium]
MDDKGIRINKYLSEAGVCSRRQADRFVEEGRVLIDGQPASAGAKVMPDSVVELDHKVLCPVEEEVFLLFHKPKGIVCTAQKREKDNVIDYLNYPVRIYPVGRLDKDSHGLLLLTNQGDMANAITKAANAHEKEYVVRVNKPITGTFLVHMAQGVYLSELDRTTAPCKIKKLSDKEFSIILTQGLNRQIRRMCKELGYRVMDLFRIRVMDFTLEGVPEGTYKTLTKEEIEGLKRKL